uniref:Uncharacterized protein n=1 Tax=Meloidogyne enterolobii TaxID=390850 RepID=A0A6V7UG14_MELEN|nr:unnamed protein product [Meloidogyne enterolobii]
MKNKCVEKGKKEGKFKLNFNKIINNQLLLENLSNIQLDIKLKKRKKFFS